VVEAVLPVIKMEQLGVQAVVVMVVMLQAHITGLVEVELQTKATLVVMVV
jgi:hypothetical protein